MKHFGRIITVNNEPMLLTSSAIFSICKGSQTALIALGRNFEGRVEYEMLSTNKVAILKFA